MTRVDFYILGSAEAGCREAFACRVVEKAWKQGYRVLVKTTDDAASRHLDELLWTFRQGSFVPHATADEADNEPVLIGASLPATATADLLVNLDSAAPASWGDYARVVEIVDAGEDGRAAGRRRFRDYRRAGAEPETHNHPG